MRRSIRLAVAAITLCSMLVSARADDSVPHVTIMQPGANRLMEDLKFLLELTDKSEQEQWANVEANLDIFLEGIDRDRPIRIDLLLGGKVVRYRPSFPVKKLDDFLINLDSFGIENKKISNSKNFYQLKEAFEGYLRYKDKYGSIGEKKEDVPTDLPDPDKSDRAAGQRRLRPRPRPAKQRQ